MSNDKVVVVNDYISIITMVTKNMKLCTVVTCYFYDKL